MGSGERRFLRPIRRHVLLLDDQEGGIVLHDGLYVDTGIHPETMDFYVVGVGNLENPGFGTGDRVVISDPAAGRRVKIDGVVYRLVRVTDVIAVIN